MYKRLEKDIAQLKKEEQFRQFHPLPSENYINLSSNDYLGLSSDKTLQKEFLKALHSKDFLMGSCSSRLLTGNSSYHENIEQILANLYQKEACLLFNSGYHANIGILPAIAQKEDLIIADKLVHSSIISGLKMGVATFLRYKHLDFNHLESLLQKNRDKYRNIYIVTESIFSMDGDVADLQALVKLKNEYGAYLYVDEAHAFGVRGEKGLGVSEEYNVIKDIDFIVGTFGKAIASVGAYVICNEIAKQFLINHSHSLIFTTALPPINLGWTQYILEKMDTLKPLRTKLEEMSRYLATKLKIDYSSHIIPHIVGSNKDTISLAKKLQKEGFWVLPIRYPTVPKGTARLRFSLSANIEKNGIDRLTETIY